MTILFDMVHPADVHFFKHAISALLQRGHQVVVTSRDKDITVPLLDELRIPHTVISRVGKGPVGLFKELFQRDFGLWRIARQCKPDIFLSNNSPCAAHIARMMRRPAIVFDDTETHRYSQRLYSPCVTEVHSPRCYRTVLGSKHRFYEGYHSLAYLHPDRFTPNADILRRAGIDPEEPLILLRFVSWGAMHDIGRPHLSMTDKYRMIEQAEQYGRVFISSEAALPSALEPYRVRLPLADIHHLVSYARLLVGDSGSMSSEAAVLGTPAMFCSDIGPGYLDELHAKYGLCFQFQPGRIDMIVDAMRRILRYSRDQEHFAAARQRLLHDNIDVTAYQLQQIHRLLSSQEISCCTRK